MAEIRGYADDVLSPIYPLDSFPTANRGLAVGGCHWGGENWADLGDGRLGGLQRQPDTAICQYAPSTPRRPWRQAPMDINFTQSGRNKILNSELMVNLAGPSQALQTCPTSSPTVGAPVRRVVILGKLVNA